MVNITDSPMHVNGAKLSYDGVTSIIAVIGFGPLLVAVKDGKLPSPTASTPLPKISLSIEGVSNAQSYFILPA